LFRISFGSLTNSGAEKIRGAPAVWSIVVKATGASCCGGDQLFATPAVRAGAKQHSEQVCDADD
jgi:hypothetical protein